MRVTNPLIAENLKKVYQMVWPNPKLKANEVPERKNRRLINLRKVFNEGAIFLSVCSLKFDRKRQYTWSNI